MKAVLSAEVPIVRFAVFAEMAWIVRRPELGLLCRATRAADNRVSVGAVQSVLPGLTIAGAQNVLGWCRMLGLCDEQGGLTALGEDVAEHDEAPVPEQGVYDLWLVQHPVIGRRVLAAARLMPTRDARFESIKPMPFEPDRSKVFRSVVDPKERFIVRSFPRNHDQGGCILGVTRATCRLRWTLDFAAERDHWQLDGMIEIQDQGTAAMGAMKHEPESDGLDLWKLAATWGLGPLSTLGRWQTDERRLAVSTQGLSDEESETFRKTLNLRRVEIPGKGTYDNVTLADVPVGPVSAAEAQRWAESRFERRIAKQPLYRSRATVRDLFADLTEGTPLERFQPSLPAHDELVGEQGHQAPKSPARYWGLAAPVDLAPYPVTRDELGALRVGVPSTSKALDSPDTVRIPYLGGWSMRRLVAGLLNETTPKKVLLCDRYVRGVDNLVALKTFVQALRAAAPAVTIEVWTGEEDADFKQIQALTGSPPGSYRQKFGRTPPHDRYLLVLPAGVPGFGWQMSNSPLDARGFERGTTLDSPLRWRDLLATCVAAEELEPTMRHWLVGDAR